MENLTIPCSPSSFSIGSIAKVVISSDSAEERLLEG